MHTLTAPTRLDWISTLRDGRERLNRGLGQMTAEQARLDAAVLALHAHLHADPRGR